MLQHKTWTLTETLSTPFSFFSRFRQRKLQVIVLWASFWMILAPYALANPGRPAEINAGLLPFSTASGEYPQAFGTTGYSIGAAYYFLGRSGIAVDFMAAGTAAVGTVSYRIFIVGEPQHKRQDLEKMPEDREKNPMVYNRKQWGLFAEAGVGMYKATKLVFEAGESKEISGGTFVLAAGGNYPIFKDFSAFFRVGMLNSVTGGLSTVFGELALSYAFNM